MFERLACLLPRDHKSALSCTIEVIQELVPLDIHITELAAKKALRLLSLKKEEETQVCDDIDPSCDQEGDFVSLPFNDR